MNRNLLRPWALLMLMASVVLPLGSAAASADGTGESGEGAAYAPAGMVAIPAGEFDMGVDERWLEKLYKPGSNKKKWHAKLEKGDNEANFLWWMLLTETPEHEVWTGPYAMDRYCVTNAQYEVYLKETSLGTFHVTGRRLSIRDLALELYGEDVEKLPNQYLLEAIYHLNRDRLDGLLEQLLKDNEGIVQAAIDAVNKDLPPKAPKIEKFDGLDPKIQIRTWFDFVLPEGTALLAYRRPLPNEWPEGRVTDEIAALPVVWVTAEDADAFAEWAGRMLPTEAEWEKAARGPKGFVYPWGEKWDVDAQKNFLLWNGSTSPPAHPLFDRPIPVNLLPEGDSGYGVRQMLGNVYQWTSSTPDLYPGSKTEGKPFFGSPFARVARGAAFGSGLPDRKKGETPTELLIRSTTRILVNEVMGALVPDRPFDTFGFRCVKHPEPARDVVAARVRALSIAAPTQLPPAKPAAGIDYDLTKAFGVERNAYVSSEEEAGPGFVFVKSATRAIGVLPMAKILHPAPKQVLESQAKENEPPIILAMLTWNQDLSLDLFELVEKAAPAPAAPEAPEEAPPAEPENAEAGDKAAEDPAPAPPAPAEPAAPAPAPLAAPELVETRAFFPADVGRAWFLGIHKGRFALFRGRSDGSFTLTGYLPSIGQANEEGPAALGDLVLKGAPADLGRSATIDPATGVLTVKLVLGTSSSISKDVFQVTVKLRFRGITGEWRQTTD